jgi:hypothetical protein
VDEVLLVPLQQLDLLIGELPPSAVQLRHAGHRNLVSGAVRVRDPRLIEEGEVQVPRAVRERDRHHRTAVARLPLVHALDPGDHRRVLADPQLPDARDLRAVDVAAGIVMQEVAHRVDLDAAQDLGRGRALGSKTRSAVRELPVDRGNGRVEAQRHRRRTRFAPAS